MVSAHLDVVTAGDETRWTHPPFAGHVADGFIWGRGALDDKSTAVGALEGLELLLAAGRQPARTVYLAFGFDEEVGGQADAARVAALLLERGIRFACILDEGSVVTQGSVPGVSKPVALVAVAEKGTVTLALEVEGVGGHSSLPPEHTAIGILAAAIVRMESHPFPLRLTSTTRQLLTTLAPEMPLLTGLAMRQLWWSAPLVTRRLSSSPGGNAMLRTTLATTVFQGGTKENVIPSSARALVNGRILPGDTIASVVAHVRLVIGDPRVRVSALPRSAHEPSSESSTETAEYRLLASTIRQVFGDVLVAPSVATSASDSRHYGALSKNILRFTPVLLTAPELSLFHGVDERIGVAAYQRLVQFHMAWMTASVQ